jgi:hypothetical protein
VDIIRIHEELLNEVKMNSKIEQAHGQLEIMEKNVIMQMVKLVGRYSNTK